MMKDPFYEKEHDNKGAYLKPKRIVGYLLIIFIGGAMFKEPCSSYKEVCEMRTMYSRAFNHVTWSVQKVEE